MVRHTPHLSSITHNLFYLALDSHPPVAMALRGLLRLHFITSVFYFEVDLH